MSELAFGNVGTGDGSPNPPQQPRSTLRYQLRPTGGYGASADFYVYNSHYKADTGTENNNRRLVEAQSIRTNSDALGDGKHIIYAGDYNIQTSTGTMYQHSQPATGRRSTPSTRPGRGTRTATTTTPPSRSSTRRRRPPARNTPAKR